MGRKYESALKREYDWQQWQQGLLTQRGKMKVGSHRMAVDVRKSDKGWDFNVVDGLHAPGTQDAVKEHLATGAGAQFKLTVTVADPERVRLSLIHSAYLTAFAVFGYEYALSPSGDKIRRILRQETVNSTIMQKAVLCISAGEDSQRSVDDGEFGIVTGPSPLKGFLFAVAPLDTLRRVVILPGFKEEDFSAYESFLAAQSSSLTFSFGVKPMPPVEFLADSASRFWGHRLLMH